MKRKLAVFLFTLGFATSAAWAGNVAHCNKLYQVCGETDECYIELLACLAR